jgi:hypothetical protein
MSRYYLCANSDSKEEITNAIVEKIDELQSFIKVANKVGLKVELVQIHEETAISVSNDFEDSRIEVKIFDEVIYHDNLTSVR